MLSAWEQQQPQAQNWEPCPLKDLELELGLSPPSLPLCWCCHCCCMSPLQGQPRVLELAGHVVPEELLPEQVTLRLRMLDALLGGAGGAPAGSTSMTMDGGGPGYDGACS